MNKTQKHLSQQRRPRGRPGGRPRGRPGGLGTQRWAVPPAVAQAAEEGGFLNWRKNQTRFPSRDKLF